MKISRLLIPSAVIFFCGAYSSCEDEVSPIGDSLVSGSITINLDTLVYDLNAVQIDNKAFDSRSGALMMGNIMTPEYGALNCSFVTRLMPATDLPDSIFSKDNFYRLGQYLDSCKINLRVMNNSFTGDALSPQKVSIYRLLNRQLPSGINSEFDPEEYYGKDNISLLGTKNYTLSLRGGNDSIKINYNNTTYTGVAVNVNVPGQLKDDGSTYYPLFSEFFDLYVNNPEVFQWPQQFASYFPGLYVNTSFGKGCVANVSDLALYAYLHHISTRKEKDEYGNEMIVYYNVRDSICLASTAPEVLSSNIISYKVSDTLKSMAETSSSTGNTVITTPGGYTARITFPVKDIISRYNNDDRNLSIISTLSLFIPASVIDNDFGLSLAPNLLLIKSSEVEDFFSNNKIPDNVSSFTATYNSTLGGFQFNGLRQYLLDMLAKKDISDEDITFTLIPVNITSESGGYNNSVTYITKCVPYIYYPTMMTLDTKHAKVMFNFSSQLMQ